MEQGWNKWGDIWAGGLGPFCHSDFAFSGLQRGWIWRNRSRRASKPLPTRLETPAAKNKNPFSVFLGPQIMKKTCDHCLTIIYIHFENNRNCFWSPKNKKSDLYGNMPYKHTVGCDCITNSLYHVTLPVNNAAVPVSEDNRCLLIASHSAEGTLPGFQLLKTSTFAAWQCFDLPSCVTEQLGQLGRIIWGTIKELYWTPMQHDHERTAVLFILVVFVQSNYCSWI